MRWLGELRQTGSHLHLIHPDRPGVLVTVARRPGQIVPLGTLKEIPRQAGLTGDELRELL
jgi:predicted RNA binding protein YcfA (HicA-like mRNA interferase family)